VNINAARAHKFTLHIQGAAGARARKVAKLVFSERDPVYELLGATAARSPV
jgi:hypothetical protein